MYVKNFINLNSKARFILLSLYVLLSFITIVNYMNGRVFAINNNRDNIPSSMTNGIGGVETLSSCFNPSTGLTYNYAQYGWISAVNSPTTLSANISQGTNSVALQFNSLSAVCNNNINSSGNIIVEDKVATKTNITSASSSLGSVDLGGKSTLIEYGLGYLYKSRYFKDWDAPSSGLFPEKTNFTLSGLGGLSAGTYTINITAFQRMIHYGTDAKFKCVDVRSASYEPRSLEDAGCLSVPAIFPVTLIITSTGNNPRGVVQADCVNGITGWARDDDITGPIEIHMYFDGMSTGISGIIADKPHPTQGLHGFSLPLSSIGIINPYDGARHTVRVYGINQGGGGNAELSGSPVSFGPCPSTSASAKPSGSANFDNDEDPSYVDLESRLVDVVGAEFNTTITRGYYVIRNGVLEEIPANLLVPVATSNPISGSLTSRWIGETFRVNNPLTALNLNIGDQICVNTTLSPATVSVGFLGAVTPNPNPNSLSLGSLNSPYTGLACDRIVNKPFISTYGGDVFAGGGFAGSACDKPSNIVGLIKTSPVRLGASSQLAAFALGQITGFISAASSDKDTLNFANTSTPPGNFGGTHCLTDITSIASGVNIDIGTDINIGSLDSRIYNFNNGITINSSNTNNKLNNNIRSAIYVNGSVTIKNNIEYANPNWNSISEIPSLHIYATGNIYIDPGVTNMTGYFFSKGEIITCANGSTPVNNSDLYQVCSNKLYVRGALAADKISLLRARGTLREASSVSENNSATSRAAEVIELGSEMYIAAPKRTPLDNKAEYQYFTTLPPIL